LTAWPDLEFPDPPRHRPYIVTNMVTTLDGKSILGERDESVMGLGSKTDYETLRFLQSKVDAVLIGANTLRATKNIWYPKELMRLVLTKDGRVPMESRFFTDVPEKAFIVTNASALPGVQHIPFEGVESLGRHLLETLGIHRLLVEGGGETNALFFAKDMVDELFLTLAPKVKLGANLPTYAGGDPLDKEDVLRWRLVGCHPIEDEVFLRYRRDRAEGAKVK
jgi:riboflavin biosynthesis pyrimidine reductase